MSDAMTNAEVEDVLSSIRRLVSEEKRVKPDQVSEPAKPSDRLILTPAQRILPEVPQEELSLDVAEGGENAVGNVTPFQPEIDAEPAEPEAQADPQDTVVQENDADEGESEQVEGAEPEANEVDDGMVAALPENFDFSQSDAVADLEQMDVDVAEGEEVRAGPDGAFIETWADVVDAGLTDLEESGEDTALVLDRMLSVEPETVAAETLDDAADTAPDEAVEALDGADAGANETASAFEDVDDDAASWPDADTLGAKVAALETLIAERTDQWDPDAVGQSDYAAKKHPPADWSEGDSKEATDEAVSSDEALRPDVSDLQTSELLDEDTNGQAELADSTVHSSEPSPAAPVADETSATLTHEELDEAALRDLVADIVREELQGNLGERITRNVRKLVRREIHRALAAQDLD